MKVWIVSTPFHVLAASGYMGQNDCLFAEEAEFVDSAFFKKVMSQKHINNIRVIPGIRQMFRDHSRVKKKLQSLNGEVQRKETICEVIYFNDADPVVQYMINLNPNARHILFEEGIGLYNDMRHRHRIFKILFGKLLFGSWYECVGRIGTYSCTDSIRCQNSAGLNSEQKKKEVCEVHYKDLYSGYLGCSVENRSSCWFVGQALVEDGDCTVEEYFSCIKKCADLAERNGSRLMIKLHPRERKEKFSACTFRDQFDIFDDMFIPVELLFSGRETAAVFSVSSSALLNLKDNPCVKAHYLFPLVRMKRKLSEKHFAVRGVRVLHDDYELESIELRSLDRE